MLRRRSSTPDRSRHRRRPAGTHSVRQLFLEQLEPRRVLTSSIPLVAADLLDTSSPAHAPGIELLLINDQLPAADAFRSAASPSTVVLTYDGTGTDTEALLELLATVLADQHARQIDSLSLVTHGEAGVVHLSNRQDWSSDSLLLQHDAMASLGEFLSEDASVLFFSCNVASTQAGRSFLRGFSDLTGATVFASDDPVGNIDNADWNWEFSTSNPQLAPWVMETSELPPVKLLGDGHERSWGSGNDSIDNAFYLGAAGGFAIDALSIHSSVDQDWYSFWLDQNGTSNDYVEVSFTHAAGDVDLELYDQDGLLVGLSETVTDNERISLEGMQGGENYFLHVVGFEGVTNSYDLVVTAAPHQFEGDWKETSDNTTMLPSITPGLGLTQLSIHAANDVDWFWFPMQAAGTSADYIKLHSFDHSRVDIDLALYDADNNFIREANSTDPTEYMSLDGLEYGWYQLSVFAAANGFLLASEYSLDLFGPAPAIVDRFEPNNLFSESISMSGAENVWDLSITADDYDIFHFDLPSVGTSAEFVEIRFDHGLGDLELELYDSNNVYVDGSYSVLDSEQIDFRQLPAGSYQAVVFGDTDTVTGEYQLLFKYPPPLLADSREDDDSSATATDLGLVSGVNQVTGLSIDQANDDDWFQFQLADWGIPGDFIEIQFEHERGDLGLALYEKAGNQVVPIWYADGTTDTERIDLAGLAPITYYAKVYGLGATNPSYDLMISQPRELVADRFEPNDAANASWDLGHLHKQVTLSGMSIHDSTDVDIFTFETMGVGGPSDFIGLDFNGHQSDLDLELYDASWNLLRSSDAVDTSHEQVSLDQLPAAVYHVRVVGYNGATAPSYSLTITPASLGSSWQDGYEQGQANDSLATATRLTSTNTGALNELTTIDNLTIHSASDVDYFQFTTIGTGIAANTVIIQFDSTAGDLDLVLLDGNGTQLRTAVAAGGREVVNLNGLPAGTYLARVSGAGNATNEYTLDVLPPRSAVASENVGDWTIMVYVTASNLQEFAFEDINEMEIAALDLPSSVNIAVFWDQSSAFPTYATPGQGAWGDAGRAIIAADADRSAVASDFERTGERDSSDPATLVEFINWATTTRPADNYGLVMWNHGSGLSGFNTDDADGSIDSDGVFTTQELVGALASVTPSIDLLAFDECLMAMLEIGYEMKDVADIIVASQEQEGGQGYDYEHLFSILNTRPAEVTAEQLGKHFVDVYQDFYQYSGGFRDTTSAIRTSQLPTIAASLQTLVTAASDATAVDWTGIVGARNGSAYYTFDYLRDLGHFLGAITRDSAIATDIRDAAAESLLALANGLVGKTADQRGSSGTSIYLPGNQSLDDFQVQYSNFDGATGWTDFANSLAAQVDLLPSVNTDWSEANDSLHNAHQLGQLPGTPLVLPSLNLNHPNDVDWFSFQVTADGESDHSILVTPTDPQANLTVSLHDSNGIALATDSGSGSRQLSLNGRSAGDYFIQVSSTDNLVTGYAVTFRAPDSGEQLTVANNSQTKAKNLGTITGNVYFSQQPVAAGAASWFVFDTTVSLQSTASSIRISVGKTVEAKLYYSNGSLVSSSQGTQLDLAYVASGSGESYRLEIIGQASDTTADLLFAVAPLAVVDDYSTSEDTLLTIPLGQSILANDHSPNSNQLTALLISPPAHGVLSLQSDGSFTYDPADEFFGNDSFQYRIDDGSALSLSTTVSIDVTEVNDPPHFDTLADVTIDEDSPERFVSLFGITVGGDENQLLQITAVSSDTSVIPNPSVQYTSPALSGTLMFTPAAEASGSSQITVTIEDGGLDGDLSTAADNGSYSQSFIVTVNIVNDPPAITPISDVTIEEDAGEQVVNLSGITAGPAESQPLRITAFSGNTNLIPSPTIEYSSAASTGTLRFTPLANAHGSVTLSVVVEDGGFDNDLATSSDNAFISTSFLVTVNPLNDPPTLDPIGNITILEDALERTVSLGGISAGPGESQPLTITATSSNTSLIPHPGVIYTSAASTGSLTFTPLLDAHGTSTITVTVEDGGLDGLLSTSGDNLTQQETFIITVTSVEDRPHAVDDSYNVDEDTTLTVSAVEGVLANDFDPEDDPISAELVSSTSHGSLTFNNDGSFQYTPNVGFNRSDTFSYRAKDAGGAGAPAQVTIAVNATHPWHNSLAPLDVNDDGIVNTLDAIMIINDINANGIRELPVERPEGTVPPLTDVNKDNHITPLDILIIINYLNELAAAEAAGGEGEGEAPPVRDSVLESPQPLFPAHRTEQQQTHKPLTKSLLQPSVDVWQQAVDTTLAEWHVRRNSSTQDELIDEELIFLLHEGRQ